MYYRIVALFFLCSPLNLCLGQNNQNENIKKSYRVHTIAFYNLENLFDTIDSPLTYDHEWTPTGKYRWTDKSYNQKLERLSETIALIGASTTDRSPVLIGVCEVENQKVLEDLINTEHLGQYNLRIIHHDSPDRRGIDVGLIYNPLYFIPTNTHSYELPLWDEKDLSKRYYTRDQLVVSGLLEDQMIHVIVNHWPSRRGGKMKSYKHRRAAARLTRSISDSLFERQPDAALIVMGDLNDDPVDKSVLSDLGSTDKIDQANSHSLYNPMIRMSKLGLGTLAWRDGWNLFDQILVSRKLITGKDNSFKLYRSGIFNPEFLITKTGPYKGYPMRAMQNGRYAGGYSDHFPVYIQLIRPVEE
ncbi:endonuclease/exonuclease/phosphatase family protein [Aureitalea marina]|uniref:Endonuclease/exonuclease/phosphatase domain-containing protein n=1 Tax=Aureitalea marina TaxID=930804 RepID=A0A2S7KSL5_9FLAO|nr:endonuclease/exonuclease/phosphatase family protein [Aureitalea marina]PQB05614.1 hypothetical protein BST85_12435 [Aureitalea marina]